MCLFYSILYKFKFLLVTPKVKGHTYPLKLSYGTRKTKVEGYIYQLKSN